MIDPAWTATERFTVAHASPGAGRTYLDRARGRARSIGHADRPRGRTAAPRSHCTTDDLLAALAGEPVPGMRVDGDVGAYLSLRKWIKRAQSE